MKTAPKQTEVTSNVDNHNKSITFVRSEINYLRAYTSFTAPTLPSDFALVQHNYVLFRFGLSKSSMNQHGKQIYRDLIL